jgi:hypothetical protein
MREIADEITIFWVCVPVGSEPQRSLRKTRQARN